MPAPSQVLLTSLVVCLSIAPVASAQYRAESFTASNGLPQTTVTAVLPTRGDRLWVATGEALVRSGRARVTTFDQRNTPALRSTPFLHRVEDPGGALLAGATQPPPPAAAIESVLVDGVPVSFEAGVRVEPGQRDVEINYTAPGFEAGHTRFRYMFEGLHRGWVDAGTRRTVHYGHLPPGTFTFRVQAAGGDGRWNEAAAVRLAVRPAFYQTIWFSAAVLIAMVLVGVGISTLRVGRLQEAERRLTARIGEATAELASANRRLEQLATIDELTQLANRRRFSETIDHEWQRAIRQATPLGLLMLDVDFFKRYNDAHGHQAGDACLQRVAAVLASRPKRASDLAARYGGEEFAVVLPETGEDGALTVAEWIRAEVERQGLPHGASPVAEVVTVSVGAAVVVPAPGMAVASLVAAADAALYRAKESGRNTVVAGTIETPPDAGAAATRFSGMRIHHPGS